MAKAAKNAPSINFGLLVALVTAGTQYVPPTEEYQALSNAGFISVDTGNVDGNGNALATPTDTGRAKVAEMNASAPAASTSAPKFEIRQFKKLTPKPPRTSGAKKYDLSSLGAPNENGFFSMIVRPTEKNPEPWKKLPSTVKSAAKRLNEQLKETPAREFDVSREEDETGAFAVIARTV